MASEAAKLAPAPGSLVPDSQFRLIGKTMPRFDIPNKVDGSAKYGIDVRLDGMLYAVIKHCPTFGGTLSGTVATPQGMTAVVITKVVAGADRGTEAVGNVNAVAVVGPNTWDTWQAVKSLRVSWTIPATAARWNDAQFFSDARALLTSATPYSATGANGPGTSFVVEGNQGTAATAISGAAKTVDATYTLPYVSHACMEVLNCTVSIANGKCDIYAPTQSAKSVLNLFSPTGGLYLLTGIPAANVTVHTTYLGGGLGRKAEVDFVSQAVQIAFAVGKPVKLMWPREAVGCVLHNFDRITIRVGYLKTRSPAGVGNTLAGTA